MLERRLAGDAEVVAVGEYGVHEPVRIAVLAQHRRAVLGMLVEGGVALVIEVVQQRDVAPGRLVLTKLAGVRPHRGLDRQRMPAQRLALRPFAEQRPGCISIVYDVVRHVKWAF